MSRSGATAAVDVRYGFGESYPFVKLRIIQGNPGEGKT